MYYGMIIGCFVVFPIISIIVAHARERHRGETPDLWELILRWFTFWIVGVRLFIAGVSQAVRPEFTAETIFDTTDPAVLPFISELGFANIAMGLVGLLSIKLRSWTPPAALLGAVFLGLDGIRHVADGGAFTADRAMAAGSDLVALVILGGGLIAYCLRSRGEKVTGSV